MGLKPIPLSAYGSTFIPPVTGTNGSLAPVANTYDSSGHFEPRSRAGSAAKRKRTDELDAVYNLSVDYPLPTPPEKPKIDLSVIKDLVVAAGVAGGEIRDMLEQPDVDPKWKAFGCLGLALLAAVEAVLESGIMPLAGAAAAAPGVAAPKTPVPPAKPSIPVGFKELREGLEKSEKECVLFGANLGPLPIANRAVLSNAFSAGLREQAISLAVEKKKDSAEAIRDLDDALSCVTELEFLGAKSKKFLKEGDSRSNTFCTLPVKFKFEDGQARINFEKTLKQHTDLRASMSVPTPIREEMKAFKAALMDRYRGEIVVVRLDTRSAELRAIRKVDKAESWTKCWERFALPHGILLPGYRANKTHVLPPMVEVRGSADSGTGANSVAAGAGIGDANTPQ
jgi:hypothetical protein